MLKQNSPRSMLQFQFYAMYTTLSSTPSYVNTLHPCWWRSTCPDYQPILSDHSVFPRLLQVPMPSLWRPPLPRVQMEVITLSMDPKCGSPTPVKPVSSWWAKNSFRSLWPSNADWIQITQVFANCDTSLGYKGISCFLVEKEMGIEIAKKEKKVGYNASLLIV